MTDLFKISTTDLTKWENTEKHNVIKSEVFEEWTDGNWITHRVVTRTKIAGSVELSFSRQNDFSAFMTLLSTARDADSYYPITVVCSNTGTTETVNAFLDITGETNWDVTAPIKNHTIVVTISQR